MNYWERILAHRHWITIRPFGRELHLCARCSGVVLGFTTSEILPQILVSSMNYSIPFHLGLSVSLVLALPSIIDWTTQSLNLRQSKNNLRLLTGFLEGLGVGVLSLTGIPALAKYLILITIGVGVLSTGVLGRRLVKDTSFNLLNVHEQHE